MGRAALRLLAEEIAQGVDDLAGPVGLPKQPLLPGLEPGPAGIAALPGMVMLGRPWRPRPGAGSGASSPRVMMDGLGMMSGLNCSRKDQLSFAPQPVIMTEGHGHQRQGASRGRGLSHRVVMDHGGATPRHRSAS